MDRNRVGGGDAYNTERNGLKINLTVDTQVNECVIQMDRVKMSEHFCV